MRSTAFQKQWERKRKKDREIDVGREKERSQGSEKKVEHQPAYLWGIWNQYSLILGVLSEFGKAVHVIAVLKISDLPCVNDQIHFQFYRWIVLNLILSIFKPPSKTYKCIFVANAQVFFVLFFQT